MFRHVFLKPMFFISFILFVALFFVLSASSWESFNFFKVWTAQQNLKIGWSYVTPNSIDSPVIGTVLAQIKVWNWQMYWARTRWDTFWLQDKATHLIQTDILEVMRNAQDPSAVFDLHTGQAELLIQDMETTYESLTELANEKQSESNDCLQLKREGDQEFFDWVAQKSEIEYMAWLEKSKEYGPCYITNRIESNAYRYLAEQSIAYRNILVQRNNTLITNREELITSYPLLFGDVAEKMVTLKRTLNQVNTTSYSNFEDFFTFWLPQNQDLPSLQNIWFRDNMLEVPNYIDPLKGIGSQISTD